MADYPYDMDLVVDPLNPANVVANGAVSILDVDGVTLLALKDPSGLPLANPVLSNAYGFIPPRIATVPQTMWKSGGFVGYFNSYKGLRDAALAAQSAAEGSEARASEAQAAAELAASTATGGGVAIDPTDPDALIISTKNDGTVITDPSDADVLLITT